MTKVYIPFLHRYNALSRLADKWWGALLLAISCYLIYGGFVVGLGYLCYKLGG